MNASQPYISISVHSAAASRCEYPIDVRLDSSLLTAVGASDFAASMTPMQLVEDEGQGPSSARPTPFQLDSTGDGTALLTFLLSGHTPAVTTRSYRLYLESAAETVQKSAPSVSVTDNVDHQEQESFRIDTQSAIYLYHKLGAGFASMIDADGADWLSYRPHGGSDGKYRGIPNLAYPESFFHPGNTDSTSRIIATGRSEPRSSRRPTTASGRADGTSTRASRV